MRIVRNVFSGIFSFVLVVVLIVLGIVVTVNLTILNPNFVISELNKSDVYSIIVDQVKKQLPEEEPYIAQIADETITDLEPWFKEQVDVVIYKGDTITLIYHIFVGQLTL